MQIKQEHICFGGTLKIIEHASDALSCNMTFSVFVPDVTSSQEHAALMFLSGLTCTHDNFTTKAGAYKKAAELGLIVIAPDTSPRGADVPDDKDSYDFGKGAGFYINATQQPWSKNYQMESYIAQELPQILSAEMGVNTKKMGISGHSMGGHGALTLCLKYPEVFKSVSAFAPIVAPSQVPWGHKAFSRYIGDDQVEWQKHDAVALMEKSQNRSDYPNILIDQGVGDQFLEEQLQPQLFEQACTGVDQSLSLRFHEGYDHSYFFIQSFIDDHLEHHHKILTNI